MKKKMKAEITGTKNVALQGKIRIVYFLIKEPQHRNLHPK
jgi:hypothetical protein